MVKIGKYNYPYDVMETVKINKSIRDETKKFCKENKINKSVLVEEFYKTILLRNRDGSIDATSGYVTLNLFRPPIKKSGNSSE